MFGSSCFVSRGSAGQGTLRVVVSSPSFPRQLGVRFALVEDLVPCDATLPSNLRGFGGDAAVTKASKHSSGPPSGEQPEKAAADASRAHLQECGPYDGLENAWSWYCGPQPGHQ